MRAPLKAVGAGALVLGSLVLATLGDPGTDPVLARRGEEFRSRLEQGEVQVSPAELLELMHDRSVRLRIVDLREEGAWNWFHLLDAERIGAAALPAWGAELDFDEIVILVDADGNTSPEAWKLLQARGIGNSYLLDGGIGAWMEQFGGAAEPRAALGDRHPASWPPARPDLEYTARVRRVGRAPVLSGGCG